MRNVNLNNCMINYRTIEGAVTPKNQRQLLQVPRMDAVGYIDAAATMNPEDGRTRSYTVIQWEA